MISKNKFENYRKISGNNWEYFWEILERIIGSSRGIIGSCLVAHLAITTYITESDLPSTSGIQTEPESDNDPTSSPQASPSPSPSLKGHKEGKGKERVDQKTPSLPH